MGGPQPGDWYIGTNGNTDPNFIDDGSHTVADYQQGLSVVLTIGAFYTEGVSALITNVISAANLVPWDFSASGTGQLSHTLYYDYKDLYIYNGSSWVDCFTTNDVLWYHHDYAQYIDTNGYPAQRTFDYTPSNGYSYIHRIAGQYYNDTDQQIYNEGYLYYVDNLHGYDLVYGS